VLHINKFITKKHDKIFIKNQNITVSTKCILAVKPDYKNLLRFSHEYRISMLIARAYPVFGISYMMKSQSNYN